MMFAYQVFAKVAAMVIVIGAIVASPAMAGSLSLSQLAAQANQRTQGEFGTTALPSRTPFETEKWQGLLAAIQQDRGTFEACLEAEDACPSPRMVKWREMMRTAAGLSEMERLRVVNRFFNAWTYRSDLEGYGETDYWATPAQFVANSGDCEDYAIAKLFSLSLLGLREESLRIVVVYDRRRALSHAVVSYRANGRAYILDSLFDAVIPDSEITQYRAVYSMNFSEGWIHVPQGRQGGRATAARASRESQFALLNTQIGE